MLTLRATAAVCDGVAFAPSRILGVGLGPRDITTGDFNHDGFDDLAAANQLTNSVTVYLSNGDRTFSPPTTFATDIPGELSAPLGIASGMLNDDEFLDLVVTSSATDRAIIFTNLGDGTFQEAQQLSTGQTPSSVDLGDLNNDGILDLVFAVSGDDDISVNLGLESGGFGPRTRTRIDSGIPGISSGFIRVIDVETGILGPSGKPHIIALVRVMQNNTTDGVAVVLETDAEGRVVSQIPYAAGPGAGTIEIIDVDLDGDQDIAVTNTGNNSITFLLNANDTFATQQRVFLSDDVEFFTVGDIDDDGDSDLIVPHRQLMGSVPSVSILLNDGGLGFIIQEQGLAGGDGLTPALADFDSDGRLDIAVTSFDLDEVEVLFGRCLSTGTCPGDINGDGAVDTADLLTVLANFGRSCH